MRPFLGGQGPKALVFTILSAKREGRWSLCLQGHLHKPHGTTSPICTLRPIFDGACDKGCLATSRNTACRVCSIALRVAYWLGTGRDYYLSVAGGQRGCTWLYLFGRKSPGWSWYSHVAKDDFELLILQPLPPKCCTTKCILCNAGGSVMNTRPALCQVSYISSLHFFFKKNTVILSCGRTNLIHRVVHSGKVKG